MGISKSPCVQSKKQHAFTCCFLVSLLSLAQVTISILSPDDDLAVANDVDATGQLLERVGGLDILLE